METFLVIAGVAVVLIVIFIKTSGTSEIMDVNKLVQKDRSVCDYINNLPGWSIDQYGQDGIQIVIRTNLGGAYNLYINYYGSRPTIKQFKELHYKLTNSTSPVMKAHKLNMPYDQYSARYKWKI